MDRSYSLRKNKQFQAVYRRGRSVANPNLVLLYLRRPELKVGISISKKVGNAVTRNRIKRRLREILRTRLSSMKKGHYVLIARNASASAGYAELDASLEQLLSRLDRVEGRK